MWSAFPLKPKSTLMRSHLSCVPLYPSARCPGLAFFSDLCVFSSQLPQVHFTRRPGIFLMGWHSRVEQAMGCGKGHCARTGLSSHLDCHCLEPQTAGSDPVTRAESLFTLAGGPPLINLQETIPAPYGAQETSLTLNPSFRGT